MAQKIIRNEELSLACTEYSRVYKQLQQAELQLKEMGALIQESLKKIFDEDLQKGEAITTYKIPVIDKSSASETGEFVQFQVKTTSVTVADDLQQELVDFLGEEAPKVVSKNKAISEILDGQELLDSLADYTLPIATNAKGDLVIKMDSVPLDQLRGITTCEVNTVVSGILDKVCTHLEAHPEGVPLIQKIVEMSASTTLVAVTSTAKTKKGK